MVLRVQEAWERLGLRTRLDRNMVVRSRGLEELSVETTLVSRRQQLQRVLVHPQDPRDFCDRRHLVPHVETEIRQEEENDLVNAAVSRRNLRPCPRHGARVP